jgi:thymidine phosphorylase
VLAGGGALERWEAMVRAQGGDPSAGLPQAAHRDEVKATAKGYLRTLDARAVGVAAWRLGAGRARKEDPVNPAAGVVCLAKPGDAVEVGQSILELHTDDPRRFDAAHAVLAGAIDIGPQPRAARPLIIERVGI